jgi:RNA polymerase sigma-70 factor (ECF subfamily)
MASPGSDDISRAFLSAQDADAALSGASDDLARALASAIDQATAAWPGVAIDRVGFAAYLGQRIPSDVDALDALRSRRIDDLYLAFACIAGDPAACRHLEAAHLTELVRRLREQGIAEDTAVETLQRVRMRLLTGERPILLTYSGIGALRGWLKIIALRDAIRAQRKVRHDERHDERDDVTDALADATADPALQYQRRRYESDFRLAFERAIRSLTVRERNLLKQSVLYGATIDDLGALYQVHRATVARWLAAARERLAELTKLGMIERLRIEPSEYESIVHLIQSQLDISVARLLG